jgi:RNA polymerase sigma-70 factor (ECF subfamily)
MAVIQPAKPNRLAIIRPGSPTDDPSVNTASGVTLDDFDGFFQAYWPRILGVLDRLVSDADEAEDLALEAFLKLYQEKDRLGPGDNPGGWLYRVASNLGLNALRSRYRRSWYEILAGRNALDSSDSPDPAEEAEGAEDRRQVRQVLAEMKPQRARLLVLRSAGLSYQELSETLSIHLNSVGPHLHRAEKEFEQRYHRLYGNWHE